MQFPGTAKPPAGILFDTSLRRIDEVLALAMLHGFESKDQARVASVSIGNGNLRAAQFCDALNHFYASATTGTAAMFMHFAPIGLAEAKPADSPMLSAPLEKKGPDGKPVQVTTVADINDTADPATLMRNALTAQYDQNAAIVLSGPATDLARLLDMYGAKDWITRKVSLLCIAESGPRADVAAARKIFAEWPTPIFKAGNEIGEALLFPGDSIDKDFAYSASHPVAEAYRAYRPMPYDAPSWAMAAVLYAVHPKDNYFKLSPPGVLSVSDNGHTSFAESSGGKHRCLILDPEQKDRIVKLYVEMASAKPVPRKMHKPADEKKKDDDKKKEDAAK